MINVAIVISGLGGGGTQQYISSLVNYLSAKNLKIYIYLTDYKDNTVRIKSAKLVYLLNKNKGFLRNLMLTFDLRKQIKKDKIDQIISFLPKVNCITALANIGLNSKLTVCERNDPIRQKLPLPWHFFKLFIYNFASNITANSKFALKTLKKNYPLKKNFYHTYNFLRENLSDIKFKNKFLKDNSFITILAVGRLADQKNYVELIKAFSLLNESNIRLFIVGDGPNRDNLFKLILDLNLESRINIIPYDENISSWYRFSDIHVMTSAYEGSPNVLWEASYFSLPSVVSSNIQAAFEILQDGKSIFMYESGNFKMLAEKIEILVNNKKKRAKIGNNAKKNTKIFLSSKVFNIWQEILKIYY